jgi:hypothetical protein
MTFGAAAKIAAEGSSPAREVLSEGKTPKHVDTDDLARVLSLERIQGPLGSNR